VLLVKWSSHRATHQPKCNAAAHRGTNNPLKLPMSKPSDDLSDETLHQSTATGEYEGRDALVVEKFCADAMKNALAPEPTASDLSEPGLPLFGFRSKRDLSLGGFEPLADPRRNFSPNAQFPGPTLKAENSPWVARFYFGSWECQFPSSFF